MSANTSRAWRPSTAETFRCAMAAVRSGVAPSITESPNALITGFGAGLAGLRGVTLPAGRGAGRCAAGLGAALVDDDGLGDRGAAASAGRGVVYTNTEISEPAITNAPAKAAGATRARVVRDSRGQPQARTTARTPPTRKGASTRRKLASARPIVSAVRSTNRCQPDIVRSISGRVTTATGQCQR